MQGEHQRTGGEAGTPAFGADGTPHPTTHRVGPDEDAAGRIRCGLCHATWNSGYEPVSACPGVRNYGWWDNVPDHLKTRTALGKKGLKVSGRAKGCVPRRRKDEYYYLFDEREAVRKRTPSAAQAGALERGRRTARKNSTCSRCGARATRGISRSRRAFPVLLSRSTRDPEEMVCEGCGAVERWELRDRPAAVAWARSLVAGPEGFVVFDSETTGLGTPYGDADFVEVAAVRGDGEVLIDSLVRPMLEVADEARAVHGIGDARLREAPSLRELHPRLSRILEGSGSRVVVYNADFDRGVWEATLRRHGLEPAAAVRTPAGVDRKNPWECAMTYHAAYVGEFYDDRGEDYRYQPLLGGDHSAVGDARATLALVRRMAEGR